MTTERHPTDDGASAPSPAARRPATTFLAVDAGPAGSSARPATVASRYARLAAAARAAVDAAGGEWVASRDGVLVAAFPSPGQAVEAAVALRGLLAAGDRRGGGPSGDGSGGADAAAHVRVAVHTGEDGPGPAGLPGPAQRRCEQLLAVARSGQALLSGRTAELLGPAVPQGAALHDHGRLRLRDLGPAERVVELVGAPGAPEPGHAGDADRVRPPRTLDDVPHNLPVELTSFVGRAGALDAVAALLADIRLVTVTGPGGSGKTRLAAHAAARESDRWPDGVWWVDLDGVNDPAAVSTLAAAAAGAPVDPAVGPLRSLVAHVGPRPTLFCVDAAEHALDATAELAEVVLQGCPGASLLVTSREPLRLPSESVWPAPTLDDDEAVALFVERARQARPSYVPGPDDEPVVRRLCRALDGIPLAVELAAAWSRTLTPRQVEAALDDRFALLVRGPRGAAPRHRTLAASVDWSHDRLAATDRTVFRRAGVCSGAFSLEVAESVVAAGDVARRDVRGALARLVDASLLTTEERGGEVRYRMLATIRRYALDRLEEAGELAATRDRHLEHALAFAEAAAPLLDTDKDTWRDRVDREYGGLRAALDWGLAADDPTRGRRLAAALPWLWHLHPYGREGLDLLRRAIARAPDERSLLQARLLAGVALVADTATPVVPDHDAVRRALELATEHGDERLRALCLALAAVARSSIDFDAAWELAAEARGVAERAGDGFVVDAADALHGLLLQHRDRHDEAGPLLDAAVRGLLARGDRGVATTVVAAQAATALATGRVGDARALAERAVAIAEPLRDHVRAGAAHGILAFALGVAGEPEAGLAALGPLLRLVDDGDRAAAPAVAWAAGALHLWRGDPSEAVRWLAPDASSSDGGTPTHVAAQALPPLAAARRALGQRDEARQAADLGAELARTRQMPGLLADALDQGGHLADRSDEALDLHHEALALRVHHGLRTAWPDSLDALAGRLAEADRLHDAARLVGAADAARAGLGVPRHPAGRAAHERTLAVLRDGLGAATWATARQDGARLDPDAAVAFARRARGARRRATTGWDSLTPAEREVVALAAAGHSNPDIAARLLMSRGTVKAHLGRVYTKLGVANRTELATAVAPHRASRP